MDFRTRMQELLTPTKRWPKFYTLVTFFTLIAISIVFLQITYQEDIFKFKESIQSLNYLIDSPIELIFSLASLLFFPILLAVAIEFSARRSLIIAVVVLSITFIVFVITNKGFEGEGFGWGVLFLCIAAFWSVVTAIVGLVFRMIINKLSTVTLISIALVFLVIGFGFPIYRIAKYSEVSVDNCVYSSTGRTSFACFKELAKTNSIDICTTLEYSAKSACIKAFIIEENDASMCETIISSLGFGGNYELTDCYTTFAFEVTNIAQCDQIPEVVGGKTHPKEACFANVAKYTKDKTLCTQIRDSSYKALCLNNVK